MSAGQIAKMMRLAAVAIVAATIAVATFGAAAAQAKPYWTINGVELKAGEKAEIKSHSIVGAEEALYIPSVKLEIRCKVVEDSGEIFGGQPGTDKETAKSKECRVANAKGEKLTACAIKGGGGAAGEIIMHLATELAYWPNKEKKRVVDVRKPETGENFVTVEITGGSCATKGEYHFTGSVVGEITPVGANPGKMLTANFRSDLPKNAAGEVIECTQEPESYETATGALVKDTLRFTVHNACLEDEDIVELTGAHAGAELDVED